MPRPRVPRLRPALAYLSARAGTLVTLASFAAFVWGLSLVWPPLAPLVGGGLVFAMCVVNYLFGRGG